MKCLALALAAASLLIAPATAPAPASFPSPYFIQLDLVEQVVCGDATGSGARIDTRTVVTAEHVISAGPCSIGGQPAEVIHRDEARDIAVLRTNNERGVRMTLACAPYVEGRTYYAVGWALGSDFVVQRLVGTKSKMQGTRWRGQAVLRGQTFKGMSGGPIVDESGAIVGIVNASPKSGHALAVSLPLADTYLCGD